MTKTHINLFFPFSPIGAHWSGFTDTLFVILTPECSEEYFRQSDGTTNVGYGTTNADAGVGIGMKRGIQKFD